jgi:NADH:ubiquinone oxidoreductase subunit 4 (subunit M)
VLLFNLILLNFFVLFLSIFLVNRIRLVNSVFSVKIKIFIILAFLLYSSLLLIFFYLSPTLDFILFSSYLKDNFFYSSQLSLYNSNLNDNNINSYLNWSVFSTYKSLAFIWYDLFGSLDSLSIIFLFMSHIVSFMVITFSSIYFDFNSLNTNLKSLNSFKITVNSVLVMTLMMDLLFVTNNLLIIFFLAELSLIPLGFLMIKDTTIFWRKFKLESLYENKRPLALYYLIFFTIVSGGFGFIGIAIIYFLFGTISLASLTSFETTNLEFLSNLINDLNKNSFSLNNIALLFSLACLIFWISVKVPLAPVHIWLPKAHVEGSTESSMLLAGVILKVTVYVLLRLTSIPAYMLLLDQYRPFLLSIAATTAILGAFGSLLTTDMKRITAYSSVSHMGIILSAGFYMSSLSVSVAPFLILLLTHTVVSTAMFMMIGCIYKSRHGVFVSRNRLTYGGLLFSFPVYFLFGAIIFSNLNVPLTMGFVGELGALIVVVKSGLTLGIVLSVASFILLLPMLSMLGQVLLGPIRLVDFFKLGSPTFLSTNIEVFYKKLVFNKIIWDKSFLDFYLANRIYFSSIFLIILGFGIFAFLFVDFLENALITFDSSLLKIASF